MPCSSRLFHLEQYQYSYQRNQPTLKDIDLDIDAGERIALVGKSGSGKSTLLRQLFSMQREQAALCPQETGLVPMLSVFHNIYMGRLDKHSSLYNLRNLIKPKSCELSRIETLCKRLGMADYLLTSVDRLSGGQKQRCAIARSLVQERDIFLGDEPVSAVDEQHADSLLELIIQSHHSCIIALHDKRLALKHFDRIIGLKKGRIVLDKASADLSEADLDTLYVSD